MRERWTSRLRKRTDPAFRKWSLHLPLGPTGKPIQPAPVPRRSPVTPHLLKVDDAVPNGRHRPGRRVGPVDEGAPWFDVGLFHHSPHVHSAAVGTLAPASRSPPKVGMMKEARL